MSIKEIREAIAAAIDTTGIVISTPYVTDQVNTPQAMVIRGDITYDDTFDGTAAYEFVVTVYVTRSAGAGQELLDDLSEPHGASSLKEALEADPDLKEVVDYAVVTGAGTPRVEVIGDSQYLAADFFVRAVR